MAEKADRPEPQPVADGATSVHPSEPAEGDRRPGVDAAPARPPHPEEAAEGPPEPER